MGPMWLVCGHKILFCGALGALARASTLDWRARARLVSRAK